MAPSNDYLLDETVQIRLAAHNPHLIKFTTVWFPGEDPVKHCDFDRSTELGLLAAFIGGFTDMDFRNGGVTVEDAEQATYGFVDEYLTKRICSTHLHPASSFNKTTQMNGQVVLVAQDGSHIMRDDRLRVATERYQVAADKFHVRVDRTVNNASKSLKVEERRSLRIAPAADLKAITERTWTEAEINAKLKLALEQHS